MPQEIARGTESQATESQGCGLHSHHLPKSPSTGAEWRELFDGVTDHAIVWLDAEGRVLSWNRGAERLFGYSEHRILGQSYARFFSPDDIRRRVPEQELQIARSEGRVEHDRWYVRRNGTRFWGSGVTTPVQERGARGFVSVVRDLTDQKYAQDMLRESEAYYRKAAEDSEELHRQRDRFLAMLSHEIRNPLAPIFTALEVMRQDDDESPIQQQTRGVIERQVRQLAHLVDDLLETTRLTAGKLHLRKEQIELRAVLERAIESARPFVDHRNHEFLVSLPSEPIWLEADPTRLEQVFLNLLNNAAKYTKQGGQIRISARREANEAVVTVSDTGIGIPGELLDSIFEMFTQVDSALDQSQGGLGIGLTLVKRLTEMHGGSVSARSGGLNQGSEFDVRLPNLIQLDEKPRPTRAEVGASPKKRLRILVADDSRDATRMLSRILSNWGNEVRTAHDGMEMLATAASFEPEMILMDIEMPKLGGYEAARCVRQQPWGQSALLVAVTGWGQEEDKRRTKAAGFDHHLVKPVELTDLQKILATRQ